jgi:hypothetical protein
MAEANEGNMDYVLQNAPLPSNAGATTKPFGLFQTPEGWLLAYCNGVPEASGVGFAPFCLCINTSSTGHYYYNAGTKAAATWTQVA